MWDFDSHLNTREKPGDSLEYERETGEILPIGGIRAVGLRPGRVQFDPVSKVFLMVISGKRVPYKCVNDGTSEEVMSNVLEFEIASARGGVYQCGRGGTHT